MKLTGAQILMEVLKEEKVETAPIPDVPLEIIEPTKEGITESVSNLNPFKRVEAETIGWSQGVKTLSADDIGVYVTKIDNNDYIKVRSVDFKRGAKEFQANIATASPTGKIEIRIDSNDGNLMGTLDIKSTGGEYDWEIQSCKIEKVGGVHDVYLVFKGDQKNLFNFDWWKVK